MRAPAAVLRCALTGLALALLVTACERRAGERALPATTAQPSHVPQTPLVAGSRAVRADIPNPFAGSAESLAEGKRLYGWFNCAGCHFEGGGGIGPAFMDGDWIYGGAPAQIFDSIASGRANGMPVYGDKLTTEQIWHLAHYVRAFDTTEAQQDSEASPPEGTP